MRLGATFCVCGAGVLAGAVLYAQNTAELTTHDAAPTFSSGVNLVLVPVVVRDDKGRAIGTLHREDFQLFDKGRLQVISKFSVETPGTPPIVRDTAVGTDAEGGAKPMPDGAQETTIIATRFVAWLFDDVHVSGANLMQAREAADKALASLEPGTRAGIFTTSGRTTLDFTDDHDMLRQTLHRIQLSPTLAGGMPDCPNIGYYMADLMINKNDDQASQAAVAQFDACTWRPPPPDVALSIVKAKAQAVLTFGDRDTRMALDTLKGLVRRMSGLPGSRAIVLVSPGFFLMDEHRTDETDLMDRAIRARVTISSLDARGLYVVGTGTDIRERLPSSPQAANLVTQYALATASANADVMAELADATGGTFFHNNNDLAEGFRRVAGQPEFVYMLGFSPLNLKLDGSFHALKVILAKNFSRYSLQARRGYFVQQHATDPVAQAKQEIEEAFFSRDEIGDLPVELHTQFFKTGARQARLSILARVDVKHLRYRKADGRNLNTLTVLAGVFDHNGNYVTASQKSIDISLTDQRLDTMPASGVIVKSTLDVPPGGYVVRLVVRDSEGQLMAAQNGLVEIP